jgi:MFS family permease
MGATRPYLAVTNFSTIHYSGKYNTRFQEALFLHPAVDFPGFYMSHLHHNIIKIYIIKAARWLMLTTPYLPLFMEDNGIDKSGFALLASLQALCIVIFEIPSGYLADVIGRKKTLIYGAFLGALGYAIYSVSFSFAGFLFALIALGIGQSLISGSDSAMLYETLKAMDRRGEYSRYEGRVIALGSLLETIGAPLGGLLALASLRYPFIAQTFVAMIAIPAALTLVEPEESARVHGGPLNLFPALKQALMHNRGLFMLLMYSALIGGGTYTMAKAIPYWFDESLRASAFELGMFWSVLNLSAAFFSHQAYKVEKRLRPLPFMVFIGSVVGGSFLALGTFPPLASMGVLLAFYCARGLATPILKNYINENTGSEVRATVLSLRMFLVYILFAALFPLMGHVGDVSGWGSALTLAGSSFLFIYALALVIFFLLQRRKFLHDDCSTS